MRVVIAGSRYLKYTIGDTSALKNDYLILRDAIWEWERKHGTITTIVSGTDGRVVRRIEGKETTFWTLPEVLLEHDTIYGADLLGEYFGRVHGIPVDRFPADWKKQGDDAGKIRNAEMISTAQGLVVVFLPDSWGSQNALRCAALKRIPIVDVCLPRRKKW